MYNNIFGSIKINKNIKYILITYYVSYIYYVQKDNKFIMENIKHAILGRKHFQGFVL